MSRRRQRRGGAYSLCGVLLVLCLVSSPAARAGTYNFITVDYGGIYQTLPYGIIQERIRFFRGLRRDNAFSRCVLRAPFASKLSLVPRTTLLGSQTLAYAARPTPTTTVSIRGLR